MDTRERIEAFLAGERPDRIPLTIYVALWRDVRDDPAWEAMYEDGLAVTYWTGFFKTRTDGVESRVERTVEDGKTVERHYQTSPAGEIWSSRVNKWRHDYWLKTPEDYRVLIDQIRRTKIEPDYERFEAMSREYGPNVLFEPATGRTPMQSIIVDYVGLENFAYHLFEHRDEMLELYDALLTQYRRRAEIVAGGPGRYVAVLENFTAGTLGPARYEEFLLPVYESVFPMLQQAGKVVGTHYDGELRCCQEAIARAPIDVIESLTPPPEGDMTLAECRAAWPEKRFWSNINVASYALPPERLRALVRERVAEAAPDGRLLAFEISEDRPENWRESIPVVLDALKETQTN